MMAAGAGIEPALVGFKGRCLTFLATPLFCAVLLSACASAPSLPEAVLVPVVASCVPAAYDQQVPATQSNADLAQMDDRQLVLTIASERLDLIAFSRAAQAVIDACR